MWKISQSLKQEISELYQASKNKHLLLEPEKIEGLPFFVLVEVLNEILLQKESDEEKRKELFLKTYSVCLRGLNPFKDKELKKWGVDPKSFKKLLKLVAKDF